ncbi:hypothetical protein ACIGW7_36590 [Streptomyces sp. NPDC053253]|uniref:hypothetical protein n=1 Tax=Streptomyces sp. NPDC053253 TaxID=3365699 RepID=UPI0037D3F138
MTARRHYHLPEPPARPDGLSPAAARRLERVVREAVEAAIRRVPPAGGDARGTGRPPREPYAPDRAATEGYRVPSFDGEGRPVVLPVRGTGAHGGGTTGRAVGGGATPRAASGVGPGGRSGAGALNLGGLAGRRRPDPSSVGSTTSQAALAAVRDRMGPAFRAAPLGRITLNTLFFGDSSAHLMPALGAAAQASPATVSARLGPGTFYLQPVPRDRMGLVAAAAPGAAYAVQRVAADGSRLDTGLRVLTRDTDPVPAGIVAYTTDTAAAPPPPPAPAGGKGGDPKQAVALIVAALPHLGPTSPASVATGLLKAYLRDLDHDGLMAAFEELRRLGHLGTVLAFARVREFREFLNARGVPRAYVLKHSELDAADLAALVGGIVWGAGESYYQVIELIGILAGSFTSEELARERHQLWLGIVALVENPVVTGTTGVGLLIATIMEKFEQREFFDLGRIVGQIAVFVWTAWTALKSAPAVARRVAHLAMTVTRVGLAVLKDIGVTFWEVLRFVLSKKHSYVTPEGITLMAVGEDVLLSGPKAKGTSALARGEIADALETAKAPLTDAELDEAFRMWDEAAKRPAPSPGEPGAAAAAAATMVTPSTLEPLVVEAITEVAGMEGSAGFSSRLRGTYLHKALSELVKKRFGAIAFEAVTEKPIREFAKLPPSLLDMPIETFVAGTPEVADHASTLKSLFQSRSSGDVRVIGDLKPDLVTRSPRGLIVWDLVSVQRQGHVAKTMLYRAVLSQGGEFVEAAELYYNHVGKTAEEIQRLRAYESAARRAAQQKALAKAIKEGRGSGGHQ